MIKLLVTLLLFIGTANAATISSSFMSNETARIQITAQEEKLTLYSESNAGEYVTNRTIVMYGPSYLYGSVMGTYVLDKKMYLYGIGTRYKFTGITLGVNEQGKSQGLGYWNLRYKDYSVNGYIDLYKDEITGRSDIMYHINQYTSLGLEYRDSTKETVFKIRLGL